MVSTAERLANVGFSATLKSKETINRLRKAGVEVLAFTLGEPDFNTPEHITQAAIKALNEGFTHYTSSMGIPELRQAVTEKVKTENKIDCKQENVIVLPTKIVGTKV